MIRRSPRWSRKMFPLVVLIGLVIHGLLLRNVEGYKIGEDPDYLIMDGQHPQISYVEARRTLATNKDLTMKYRTKKNHASLPNDEDSHIQQSQQGETVTVLDDVPQYFSDLNDEAVEAEVEYRVKFDRWSDRVILEKLYFNLMWGKSGFPDHYYDSNGEIENGNKVDESNIDSTESSTPTIPKLETADGWDIFDRTEDHCTWTGITCDGQKVTEIRLDNYDLPGKITDDIQYLSDLEHLDVKGNNIHGTIPTKLGKLSNLKFLCLAVNRFIGTIPMQLSSLSSLQKIWLSSNMLSGTLPRNLLRRWPLLTLLDLSNNKFHGTVPESYTSEASKISNLFLEYNKLTGQLPENSKGLQSLQVFDIGHNHITGTIPRDWMELTLLKDFNIAGNQISGTIPTELLNLSNLSILVMNDNRLSGTLPQGNPVSSKLLKDADFTAHYDGKFANLTKLSVVMLNNNELSGQWPPELFHSSRVTLANLDIGNNNLEGPLPSNLGDLKNVKRLYVQQNRFSGRLPSTMSRMNPGLELNLTGNLLEGTVPKLFCGAGAMSTSLLIRQNGCDAILCPPGTFHPAGAATMYSGCRPCPEELDTQGDLLSSKAMGRLECPGVEFIHGDLDGDGELSDREILRLLWSYTAGMNWGAQFKTWEDPKIGACDLNGVACSSGKVIKVDLTDAALCSNGERKQGPIQNCLGLPAELGSLSHLEVLNLNRRQFLHGTIPAEIGEVASLKYIDLGNCPNMVGTVPSELGKLTNMQFINFSGCHFNGTIPEAFYNMTSLEKLHLSMNMFSGTVSTNIGRLKILKELLWSRTQSTGSIPYEIGQLTMLENLEMYGNNFTGSIPSSLGECSMLKRVDLFNNELSGKLPTSLTKLTLLQILHLKLNQLTGTIPSSFGDLSFLSWFDVSSNRLHGTIPSTFGATRSIKDFRLGGNMIYDPIPPSLCSNTHINGGLTKTYGCDGVICPLGTYSDPGHATHSDGCKKCPDGATTLYLGSSSCETLTEADILAIFYNVMGGSSDSIVQQHHWRDPKGDVCKWNGINCDDQGEIRSIRFPLYGMEDPAFF